MKEKQASEQTLQIFTGKSQQINIRTKIKMDQKRHSGAENVNNVKNRQMYQ